MFDGIMTDFFESLINTAGKLTKCFIYVRSCCGLRLLCCIR